MILHLKVGAISALFTAATSVLADTSPHTCTSTITTTIDGTPATAPILYRCVSPIANGTGAYHPTVTISPKCIAALACTENSTYASPRESAFCTPGGVSKFYAACNKDSSDKFDLLTPGGPFYGKRSYQPTYGGCAQFCDSTEKCNGFAWRGNQDTGGNNCYLKAFNTTAKHDIGHKAGIYLGLDYSLYLEMNPEESSTSMAPATTPTPTGPISTLTPWGNNSSSVVSPGTTMGSTLAATPNTFTPFGCPEPRENVTYSLNSTIDCEKSAEGWSKDGGVAYVSANNLFRYKISCFIAYFHSGNAAVSERPLVKVRDFNDCVFKCMENKECNAFTFFNTDNTCQLLKTNVGLYARYQRSACTGVDIWSLGLAKPEL